MGFGGQVLHTLSIHLSNCISVRVKVIMKRQTRIDGTFDHTKMIKYRFGSLTTDVLTVDCVQVESFDGDLRDCPCEVVYIAEKQ